MKNCFLFSLLICYSIVFSQNDVGIGTTTPYSSAPLEVYSQSRYFLPPGMTYKERSQIHSPVAGLISWCANCGAKGELEIFNGTNWTNTTGSSTSASPNIIIYLQQTK